MKIAKCLVLFGLLTLLAGTANAQPQVVDLLAGSEPRFGAGEWLEVNGRVLYSTQDFRGTGPELYHLDLEAERVERLASFCPRQGNQETEIIWQGPTRAVLIARCKETSGTERRTWTTDGTRAGTREFFSPRSLRRVGQVAEDRILVTMNALDSTTPELWSTDGSPEGSLKIFEGLLIGTIADPPQQGERILPWTVFGANHPELGSGLWFSDGTREGTRFVPIPTPGSSTLGVVQIGRVADRYWFTSNTPGTVGLWTTDGTVAGSRRVIEGLSDGPLFEHSVRFAVGDQKTYFRLPNRYQFSSQDDLWGTDGTVAGTSRLTRLVDLPEKTTFRALEVWGDRAHFLLDPERSASVFWTSDGTLSGTSPTPGLGPGGVDLQPAQLQKTRFGILFVAADLEDHPALWIVDDASPLPRKVFDAEFRLEAGGSSTMQVITTNPGFTGAPYELWSTNGSRGGTREFHAFRKDEAYSLSVFVASDGKILWRAQDGDQRSRFWVSDGTLAGTASLSYQDFGAPWSSRPRELHRVGEIVTLIYQEPGFDDELESEIVIDRLVGSDGTPAGTRPFVYFPPGLPSEPRFFSNPTPIGGNRLFFEVEDPFQQIPELRGLWVADGRDGGTLKLPNVDPEGHGSYDNLSALPDGALAIAFRDRDRWLFRLYADGREPLELAPGKSFGSFQFFLVGEHIHLSSGFSMWRTDGTVEGTRQAFEQQPRWLLSRGPELIFRDFDLELWSYDGVRPPERSSLALGEILGNGAVAVGTKVFGIKVGELLVFDGNTTRSLRNFQNIQTRVPFEGGLAFVASEDRSDAELWFSDGSTAGTRRIADLWPGPLGSYPGDLQVVGDRLFFTAHDGSHGRELWSTDGTESGTLMYDVNPGVGSSVPAELTVAGGKLFFSAYDDTHGRELWSLDLGDDFAPPPPSGTWLSSPAIPGFRFQVRIAEGTTGRLEPTCLQETACISGAVAGRPEVFLRVVGPRGNGFLWPTLVKFNTSEVEIWLEQTATGAVKYYSLAGARPGVDELPARFDRLGFRPPSAAGPALVAVPALAGGPDFSALPDAGPPPPAGTSFFESPALPGFRVAVRITAGASVPPVRRETSCIAETLCLSGAVPGRSEVFVRVVGPKPNGFLWPTLARFTSSQVEVWIEQKATGARQYYLLPGASADSDDLTGLFDREGFEP
jgi:ELWxxDGT repeat protein